MNKISIIICASLLASILLASCGSSKEHEDSQVKIERIVLAAYSPEGNELIDRDAALSENIRERFLYDNDGNLIWQRSFARVGSDYALQTLTIARDEHGRPAEQTIVNDRTGERKSRYVFNYHGQSKDVDIEHYDENDRLSSTEAERYDSRGNLTSREVTYTASGQTERTSIEYGADDLPIKETHFNLDGSIDWIWIFGYDEFENRIERRTEIYHDPRDREVYVLFTEYDDRNNVTSKILVDEDGNTIEELLFEYIYDEHGNWITKKKYSILDFVTKENPSSSNFEYVWERRIEYFGSTASAMREAGCIFLEDTLNICPYDHLENLNQHTPNHIGVGVSIPGTGSEYMGDRIFGISIEIVSDEFCLLRCLGRQTSVWIEKHLDLRPSLKLLSSEEAKLGNHKGSLTLFESNDVSANQRVELGAMFLTRINGRFVLFHTVDIFNARDTHKTDRIDGLKRALELTLESVTSF